MAEEFDYLEDSEYGKVATSILDRSKKKSGFFQSGNLLGLVADVAAQYINKKNRDLQAEQSKNIATLTRQYNRVINTRKDYFNSNAIKKQREDYQLWKNPETKEKARLAKAIEYFNQSPAMQLEFQSSTPYEEYKKLPRNEKNSKLMYETLELLKGSADIYFESITDDALVQPTQTEYIQEVQDAFETSLNEAENDPTKKSFIRKQFLKAFGRDEKGNPRFGLVNQDKLKNLRINAERSAGIGRDNALQIITDLDIADREVDEKVSLKRPELKGIDFITEKPKTSRANSDDRSLINNALADRKNFFNKDNKFKIRDRFGTIRTLSVKDIYDQIDKYNGNPDMEGRYTRNSFLADIFTISDANRKEFEEKNYEGVKASAQQFLLPAIAEVVERLSNGLPSRGFENITQAFNSDMEIFYTYGPTGEMVKTNYKKLSDDLDTLSKEDREKFIDNMIFDSEFKIVIDSLK